MEPRRNIELKSKDIDPQRSLATCKEIGAEERGLLAQRDTYFNASHGRLKLREEEGSPAQLIAFQRADLANQRTSHYRLVDVARPEALKGALASALGVKVVVAKERHLFSGRKTCGSISTWSRGLATSSSSRRWPRPIPI